MNVNFDFKVIATSFATISLVIAAVGFLTGHDGVGWGFVLLGFGTFIITVLTNRGDV